LASKERKLLSELPSMKWTDPSDVPRWMQPAKIQEADLTKTKPIDIAKTPPKEETPLAESTIPLETSLEPPSKLNEGAIQLSSLNWVNHHRELTSEPIRYPYVLVIGSFENIEKALPNLEKLYLNEEPFFTSWIASGSGQMWYQVYNGWYPDKTSASNAALSVIEKYQLQNILVRKAPYTLWIKTNTIYPTFATTKQYLNEMAITPYQIGNRLMVGAYRVDKVDEISVIDELTAAGLSFQLIVR